MNITHYGTSDSGRSYLPMVPGDAALLAPEFAFEREAGNLLDLRKIWSAMWRNRLVALASLGVSLTAGVLILFLAHATYRATASIEIDEQPVKVLGTEDVQPVGGAQEADRLLQTQIDVLGSRSLALRVADSLNLAGNDDFLDSMGVKPKPNVRREQVVEALQTHLGVRLPRNSRVVPINFDSQDPRLAAKIANSYAENLISANLQRHFDTSSYSKEFLQNQLTLTKGRLENSERALLDYARSVGIVDPSAGGGDPNDPSNNAPRSLTSANLIDLNQSLAAAKANRIQAQGRWNEAKRTSAMSLPEVLGNPAIQQMTQHRAELESEYQQELQHRKPDHPAVQQAAAALKELNQQIGSLAGSIKSSIRNQYMIAQQQESDLSSAVGQLKGATLAEQSLGIRYNILKREVDTNRQLYDGLLQRYKEVSAEAGVTANNISIIDRADSPLLPFSPNPAIVMSLAMIGGFLIAFILIAGLEMFHDGVRAPNEIEDRFGVALLGAVPRLARSASTSALLKEPRSQISEAYQAVRASVELSAEGGSPRTLLITSCRESEGKSTTALAMARSMAQSGRSVLLIDADMRRPSLHRSLRIPKTPGLSNLLTQDIADVVAIYPTETDGLSIMPSGPLPPSPAELLSGVRFPALLDRLKERFDQIIIDSPPVLGLADAPRIAAVASGTLMVIEANRSQRGAVDSAIRRLLAARARIVGAVLVKFDPKKADYGSDYLVSYYSYGELEDEIASGDPQPAAA